MSIEPAPITVEPSGDFLGNDGSWSAFKISVGEPPQEIQVLPSSEISQTLVVLPDGCMDSDDYPSNWNCNDERGGIFNYNESPKNWITKGNFTLDISANLGLGGNGDGGTFGYDTLAIPTANGASVTLDQQLLSGVATKDFFVGSLGLSSRPISFESQVKGQPPDTRQSLITSLKDKNLIPSLSYGYTAGASYRNQTASLTLGGYDASRFVPNDLSIEFAPTPRRQLVVALKKITFSDSDSEDKSLLTDGILTLVDSTVPDIWLPQDACRLFEEAFNISEHSISKRYLVDSTQHADLLRRNPSITFELGGSIGAGDSVMITLPYDSFDLEVDYPIVPEASRYFPLRQAADDTEYTLGRTLLQESFLIVDYGSQKFSISQTTTSNAPADVVPIAASNLSATDPSSTETPTAPGGPAIVKTVNKSSGFPVGAIAGIVVALVVVVFAVGGWFLYKYLKKRKQNRPITPELASDVPYQYPKDRQEVEGNSSGSFSGKKEAIGANEYSVHEMESPPMEMGDNRVYFEGSYNSFGHGCPSELPTDIPPRSELSSPEPVSRQASPTPELSSRDPQCFLSEMASPTLSAQNTPPLEPVSALSSPRWSRPGLGSRRPAHHRLSSDVSDESGLTTLPIQRMGSQNSAFSKDGAPPHPPHNRKDSNDSGVTQDTVPICRPSQLHKDSTESGFSLDAHPRQRPGFHRMDSTDSDPLKSPKQIYHQLMSHRDSTTMRTRMEEETDSDPEIHAAELVQRGSAQLINQSSPPSSPSKQPYPRKEVASAPSMHIRTHDRG